MRRGVLRQRYYVLISGLYILAGAVMLARAAIAHAMPVIILGLVFVGLGAVRLRDFTRWRESRR